MGKSITGKQFDTSADGSGPGKAGGAVMSGAATGFKAGMATGNPVLAAGAAVVGGGLAAIGHSTAMRKYGDNLIKKNIGLNTLEKAKNEELYAMERGKESLGLLKGLRQKQLGISNKKVEISNIRE